MRGHDGATLTRGTIFSGVVAFLAFGCYDPGMRHAPSDSDLLTTGKAAALLGVSRQHVVDLCEGGNLPFRTAGVHRRLRREDVEKFARARASGHKLRREEARSLWLNQVVAGKLVQDPDTVLGLARDNLTRFMRVHPEGMSAYWLRRWRDVLDQGADAVLAALTSTSKEGIDLRQNSPFAGALPEDERQRVLKAFANYWRRRGTA